MIDYHIHTELCNHAEQPMEAYIKRAIHLGLTEICFLDHLIMDPSLSRQSMAPNEVALYFQAIQHFKYLYRDKIKVKAGLEVDFVPDKIDLIEEILGRFSFDVIGGSAHFINGHAVVSRGSAQDLSMAEFDDLSLTYLDRISHMLDHDYFDMVCHLDVTKKFGQKTSQSFEEKYDEILSKIRYKNLTVEVNTSGYLHPANDLYPGEWLLQKCLEKGIQVTLSSDSHHPNSIAQHFDKALSILYSIGYRNLTGYNRRSPYEIPINGMKP